MVELKHTVINEIPVIEMFKKGSENLKLPTVFFYHGWESRKERVLEYGYILARRGFRAVLPEAFNHGERLKGNKAQQDPLNFWEVVGSNVREFPQLVEYYLSHNKIQPEKIGVAGLSMGGITTSAMLTQYDWINSAAVLMGSPSPIEFTEWLLNNYKIDGTPINNLLNQELVQERLEELKPIALNLQPEKINGLPIYFWHGTEDPIVPAHITERFIDQVEDETYANNIIFETSEGVGHTVPQAVILRLADFLEQHLI